MVGAPSTARDDPLGARAIDQPARSNKVRSWSKVDARSPPPNCGLQIDAPPAARA